jgi:hypothetical protein
MNIQFSVLSDNKQALFLLPLSLFALPHSHDNTDDIDDGEKDIYVPPKFTRIFEMVIEIIFLSVRRPLEISSLSIAINSIFGAKRKNEERWRHYEVK